MKAQGECFGVISYFGWQKARVGEIEDELVFQNVAKNYSIDAETVKKWLLSRREPNQEVLDLVTKIKPEIKKQ